MVRTAILTEFMLTIALLLQLIGLTFAVMIDTYLRKEQRKAMLIIVSLTFLLELIPKLPKVWYNYKKPKRMIDSG